MIHNKNTVKFNLNHIGIVDWIFFGIFAFFCFLFLGHTDILYTAERATQYLEGNIWDFYSKCHEMSGDWGANYLPSTFLAFALWNIPLKLLSLLPRSWADWNLIFILWNKLLPVIIYFISGLILRRFGNEILRLGKKQSNLLCYMFLASPIAFFSQFIFCQYDIFTVFFMLLGIYAYFYSFRDKKYNKFFIIFFSIATTFKYFAILIFLVLLLLRVKSVYKILINSLLVLFPTIFSCAIYLLMDYEAFKNGVVGFKVLGYVQNTGISIGFASLNLMPIIGLLILALAYFKKCETEKEYLQYLLFYCCGMCFAIFGFMTWHPQWLMFAIIFWNISFVLNSNIYTFLWLDTIFAIIFNVFVANIFVNSIDQDLFRNGILYQELFNKEKIPMTMAEIYCYHDTNMLFSIMFAVMLIYFIFSYPKHNVSKLIDAMPYNAARIRFYIPILTFIIPAIVCLKPMFESNDILWKYEDVSQKQQIVELSNESFVTQITNICGKSIAEVNVQTYSEYLVSENISLIMIIQDDKGKEVAWSKIEKSEIYPEEILTFKFEDVLIEDGGIYQFSIFFEGSEDSKIGIYQYEFGDNLGVDIHVVQKDYSEAYTEYSGILQKNRILNMTIKGEK